MDQSHHILIVDDEASTRTMLTAYLEKEGYRVSAVGNGAEMWDVMRQGTVDLVLMDIRLPGTDGLTLMRELRATSNIGIIMVTGQTDEVDQIIGLESGADHYVTKPFNPRDLLARVRSVLRRTADDRDMPVVGAEDEKHFAGWTLNVPQRRLTRPNGEEVKLTRAEFELLTTFVHNPHTVMTRDALLDHVSHREWAPNDRSVDVLVGRLRRKVEEDPNAPRIILTERGVGYVFVESAT